MSAHAHPATEIQEPDFDDGFDVSFVYEPDDERAARGLLRILGISPEETERIVSDLKLASTEEM
jgi:hypothetical protein